MSLKYEHVKEDSEQVTCKFPLLGDSRRVSMEIELGRSSSLLLNVFQASLCPTQHWLETVGCFLVFVFGMLPVIPCPVLGGLF